MTKILVIAAALLAITGGLYFFNPFAAMQAKEDEAAVRALIEEFGTKLKNVSLLNEGGVWSQIQNIYGPYLTRELLDEWARNPAKALGRQTSSPWPERIEVGSLERRSDTEYLVQSYLIEVTNEGSGIGETPTETSRRAVVFTVRLVDDMWRIAGVALGERPGEGEWKYTEPDARGLQFQYPDPLPTQFISAQEWPPKVSLVAEDFVCETGERADATGALVNTEERTVGDRVYCIDMSSEGAAGSTYTTYTYRTEQGDFVAHVDFTLRYVQCMNYDEANQGMCTLEQETFDVDGLVDRIASSIRMS